MLIVRKPAVKKVWEYAKKIGVPPENHVARWIEATELVVQGRTEDAARGKVKKVVPIYENGILVGVKADVR